MARSCLSVAHWLLLFILSTSSHAWNISAPTFPASIPSHALRRRAPYVYAESHPTWLNQTLNKWDNISVEAHGKRQIEQVELEATCSKKDLSLNFPRLFTLDDGRFSAAEILGRLRDQACAGICGPVPGIPEKLTQWQRQSTSGCEYAVKVGPKWELYLSASDAGANCRDSSTTAIERCMTEKNRSTRLKDGAKMEGPNDGEFGSPVFILHLSFSFFHPSFFIFHFSFFIFQPSFFILSRLLLPDPAPFRLPILPSHQIPTSPHHISLTDHSRLPRRRVLLHRHPTHGCQG